MRGTSCPALPWGLSKHQLAWFAPCPNLALLQHSFPQHLRPHRPALGAALFQVCEPSFFRVHIQININKSVHSYSVDYLLARCAKLMAAHQVLGIPVLFCFIFAHLPLFWQHSTLYYTVLGLSENAGSYALGPWMLLGGEFSLSLSWCLGTLNPLRVS